jgi:hypothetical protein
MLITSPQANLTDRYRLTQPATLAMVAGSKTTAKNFSLDKNILKVEGAFVSFAPKLH